MTDVRDGNWVQAGMWVATNLLIGCKISITCGGFSLVPPNVIVQLVFIFLFFGIPWDLFVTTIPTYNGVSN